MNTYKRKIVIIGATSAIAEHCARLWAAEKPAEIILVGRDHIKIELVAADLRVRTPNTRITSVETDFLDSNKIQSLADDICKKGAVDIVLIAHGSLPDQQGCQNNLAECHEALEINGVSPVLFAQAFAVHMEKADKGTLAIIGSVAGDRGRKSNYVYGAAKGLVTRYAQGLQHRLAKSGVAVVLVKPGPTDTPMTAHLKKEGARLASPDSVAQCIVNGVAQGKTVVYAPAKWALIMMVIRHLPNFVFKRMDI
jgi:decaprenylphospho-beta-D-erythro-pentofuranosid-2-ulose 2-reductase